MDLKDVSRKKQLSCPSLDFNHIKDLFETSEKNVNTKKVDGSQVSYNDFVEGLKDCNEIATKEINSEELSKGNIISHENNFQNSDNLNSAENNVEQGDPSFICFDDNPNQIDNDKYKLDHPNHLNLDSGIQQRIHANSGSCKYGNLLNSPIYTKYTGKSFLTPLRNHNLQFELLPQARNMTKLCQIHTPSQSFLMHYNSRKNDLKIGLKNQFQRNVKKIDNDWNRFNFQEIKEGFELSQATSIFSTLAFPNKNPVY